MKRWNNLADKFQQEVNSYYRAVSGYNKPSCSITDKFPEYKFSDMRDYIGAI